MSEGRDSHACLTKVDAGRLERTSVKASEPLPTNLPDARVLLAVRMLRHAAETDIPLDAVAAATNLSSSRLRHLFRAELGVSPAEFKALAKLRAAKELLETSRLTVGQVAAAVGFQNASPFIRAFKRAFKQTPSECRRLSPHKVNRVGTNQEAEKEYALKLRDNLALVALGFLARYKIRAADHGITGNQQ